MFRIQHASKRIRSKMRRGQALLELMGVIPGFLLVLSIILSSAWWTYSRMNAISRSYFTAMQSSSYNRPFDLSIKDDFNSDISTGKPYWDHSEGFGSGAFLLPFRVGAKMRMETWLIRGMVVPNDETYFINIFLFFNPHLEKSGNPQATLNGMYCLFCSDQRTDINK